jgi:16S rRNA processing protein RimM
VELVRIGKVVRALGLRGFVGVAGSEGALGTLRQVALRRGEAAAEVRQVLEARPQGRLWAVRLEGIADRRSAEGCVGSEVYAEREALGDAGEGKHFWADLEGLRVETVDGTTLGEVTGFYETGGVDVLVVRGDRGEKLIPLAPYVTIDRAARRVIVDPPEGLLEV